MEQEEEYTQNEINAVAELLCNQDRRMRLVQLMKDIRPDVLSLLAHEEFTLRRRTRKCITRLRTFHPITLVPTITKTIIHPKTACPVFATKSTVEINGKTYTGVGRFPENELCRGFIQYRDNDERPMLHNPESGESIDNPSYALQPSWRHDECMLERRGFGYGIYKDESSIELQPDEEHPVIIGRRDSEGRLEIQPNEFNTGSCIISITRYKEGTLAEIEFFGEEEETWRYSFGPYYKSWSIIELEPGGVLTWWVHDRKEGKRMKVQLFQDVLDELSDLPDDMIRFVSSYLIPF